MVITIIPKEQRDLAGLSPDNFDPHLISRLLDGLCRFAGSLAGLDPPGSCLRTFLVFARTLMTIHVKSGSRLSVRLQCQVARLLAR